MSSLRVSYSISYNKLYRINLGNYLVWGKQGKEIYNMHNRYKFNTSETASERDERKGTAIIKN